MQLPQPGEQFDNAYLLDEVLGEGGFAVVFGATELAESGRKVAIKVLRPDKKGQYVHDVEPRFAREVASLACLNNAHTMQIYGHGKTAGGLLYLVSEYIPGVDLDELMAERRLSSEEVVRIVRQVLEALHEAHSAGLLHRDIKPRNIRITETASGLHAKLIDFGVAKSAFGGHTKDLTKTGELLGTPQYMSPEQLTEDRLSPASDIYSLGLVTYEMLTGGKIHGASWGEQLDRLVSGHVFSMPELERMGPGLTKIVEKMSARHAEHRYQSAAEVLRAFDDLDQGKTLPERMRPTVQDLELRRAAAATVPDIEYKQSAASSTDVKVLIGALAVFGLVVAGVLLYEPGGGPVAEQDLTLPRTHDANRKPPRDTPRGHPPAVPDQVAPDMRSAGPSLGCGLDVPFSGQSEFTRMVGLSEERWTVHIPTRYDPTKPYPLVILFHPDLSNGAEILGKTGFGAVADEHGFVVLAPNGALIAWRTADAHHGIRGLAIETSERLCIDPRRVYAVGHGVGGIAVEELACDGWLAGIATNAYRRHNQLCPNPPPIPFLHLAPIDSQRIPVEGGIGCNLGEPKPALAEFEATWRGRNGCTDASTEWLRVGKHQCKEWTCAAPFVSCHLDGGYSWPGSGISEPAAACVDRIIEGFDASQVIWKFFDTLALADDATPAW